MKTTHAIGVLTVVVLLYHYASRPGYERVEFNPTGPVVNNAGQWYERTQIRDHIRKDVEARNFYQLSAKVIEARTQGLQFTTTISVLLDLYNGMAYSLPDYDAIHAFIAQWRGHDPSSNIPDILEARAHIAQGWEIRGNGYSSYVSDEQFEGFRAYLAKAWESAQMAEQKGPMDAELCSVLVKLSFVHKKNKLKARNYFKQCQEIELGYIPVYQHMRTYLQRIWLGSDRELRQFIEQAAEDTQHLYGDGMYAILVADHTFNTSVIFEKNGGPYLWSRVKAGFEDIFKKYGYSDHILHEYGYCAMLAEEHETFAEILQHIGTEWDDNKQHYFRKKSWYEYHLSKTKPFMD